MPDNKKHHYVSQFYLRNFGIGRSISLFNIPSRRHVPTAPIPGQCQRAYLYGSDNKKEGELAELEGRACGVIRSILASRTPPEPGGDAHRALAEYISVQLGRTPDAAASLQLTREKIFRALAKDFATRNAFPESAAAGIKAPTGTDPVAASLSISENQGALLLDLDMRLLLASGRAFVTSDLPVVLYNQWSRHYKASGVRGLTCSGLIVLLPLSPEVCLLMFDSDVYAASKKATCITIDEPDAITVNAAQLLGVENNLYYRADSATRSQIDGMPMHWSRRRSERNRLRRARSDETNSTLLYVYEDQPDVSLKFRFLRQLGRAKQLTTSERGRSWRPAAVAEAEKLELSSNDDRPRPIKPGTTWRVVERE